MIRALKIVALRYNARSYIHLSAAPLLVGDISPLIGSLLYAVLGLGGPFGSAVANLSGLVLCIVNEATHTGLVAGGVVLGLLCAVLGTAGHLHDRDHRNRDRSSSEMKHEMLSIIS